LSEEGNCDNRGGGHRAPPFDFGTADDLNEAFGPPGHCGCGPIHDFDDLYDPQAEHAAKLACKSAHCPVCWGRRKAAFAVAIGCAIDDRPDAAWYVLTGRFDDRRYNAMKRQVERTGGVCIRIADKVTGDQLILTTAELPDATPQPDRRELWLTGLRFLAELHAPQPRQRPVTATCGVLPPEGGEYLPREGRRRLRQIDCRVRVLNDELRPAGLSSDAPEVLLDIHQGQLAPEGVRRLEEKRDLRAEKRRLLNLKLPTMRRSGTYDTTDWDEVMRRHLELRQETDVTINEWDHREDAGVLNGLTRLYGEGVTPSQRWWARLRLTGRTLVNDSGGNGDAPPPSPPPGGGPGTARPGPAQPEQGRSFNAAEGEASASPSAALNNGLAVGGIPSVTVDDTVDTGDVPPSPAGDAPPPAPPPGGGEAAEAGGGGGAAEGGAEALHAPPRQEAGATPAPPPPPAPEDAVVPELRGAARKLSNSMSAVAREGARELGASGHAGAVPHLLRALRPGFRSILPEVVEALFRLGELAVGPLREAHSVENNAELRALLGGVCEELDRRARGLPPRPAEEVVGRPDEVNGELADDWSRT
jgi:hypothetical protein